MPKENRPIILVFEYNLFPNSIKVPLGRNKYLNTSDSNTILLSYQHTQSLISQFSGFLPFYFVPEDFTNITKTIDIALGECILNSTDHLLDPVEIAIEKYKHHPSIRKIKDKVSHGTFFEF